MFANGLPPIRSNKTERVSFRARRDKVVATRGIIHKSRTPPNNAYTFVTITEGSAQVIMPYTGTLFLSISGASAGDTVLITNPFVSGDSRQYVLLAGTPDTEATITVHPGQVDLNLTTGVDGEYIITVDN